VDTDNYSITRNLTYASPSREGHPEYWDPATLNQTALEPFWGTLRPIFLYNVNACEVPLSIPFGTDETSSMYAEAKVVYDVSVNLTQEQKDIAYYWADNPGQSSTPPGHWIMIMGQMTENLHLNLERTSEMYALGSIALADAFITCWYTKYKYNLLRPVTYIREFMGHPEWTSFIGTPPFPEYTSGHSTGSGAASAQCAFSITLKRQHKKPPTRACMAVFITPTVTQKDWNKADVLANKFCLPSNSEINLILLLRTEKPSCHLRQEGFLL